MKTYVTLILDQSGSMEDTKEQAVSGYNEQVQQMKENAKGQDIFCSLVTFNGSVFEHLWCEEAEKLEEASTDDYLANGATAMRDAIGYTVDKLLKTTVADDDTAYLVVVISDGAENASTRYTVPQLRQLVDRVQNTGKWTFTYLGCDEEYLKKVSAETNIPLQNMAKWSNATAALASNAMKLNKKCLDKYYESRARGETRCCALYSNDGIGDFTKEDTSEVLLVAPPVTQSCVKGTTPFKNYSPVNW